MKMTNLEIYNAARAMIDAFQEHQYLPVKVNFFIQKNKSILTTLAQDIDNARMTLISNYGVLNEEGTQYIVPEEKMEAANKELSDLFNIEQDVNITKINIEDFPDDIKLTGKQMESILFMIN